MFSIVPLRDRVDAIEQLARWHHAQWGAWSPENTVERRIARLHEHLSPSRIPQTFVAVEDTAVLGSASLVHGDLDTHNHYSPWLASVYVDSPHRRRGIGTALVERAAREARSLGETTLYLFTPDRAPFYARLGWTPVEHTQWMQTPVVVMQFDLTRLL